MAVTWNQNRKYWTGECPRCGHRAHFLMVWENAFQDGSRFDVVECPEGHPFLISTRAASDRTEIKFVAPVSGRSSVPEWLPDEYVNAYSEMFFDFKSGKYRSSIAMAGTVLDAHINSLLKYAGDKKKPLAKRLEILIESHLIDSDQFADATVARLSRNGVAHPEDIAIEIKEEEAREAIEAVSSCLERFYRWRRAKALPAPKDKVGDDAAPENQEEKAHQEVSSESDDKLITPLTG